MSNVISFDPNKTTKGDASVDELVHHLIEDEGIDRGMIMGMSDDGKINITLAGEFQNSELLLFAEILREHAMVGVKMYV